MRYGSDAGQFMRALPSQQCLTPQILQSALNLRSESRIRIGTGPCRRTPASIAIASGFVLLSKKAILISTRRPLSSTWLSGSYGPEPSPRQLPWKNNKDSNFPPESVDDGTDEVPWAPSKAASIVPAESVSVAQPVSAHS
jgi:hypothetical protein